MTDELQHLRERIESSEAAIQTLHDRQLRDGVAASFDLGPLEARLTLLESQQQPDLMPIFQRLDTLENGMQRIEASIRSIVDGLGRLTNSLATTHAIATGEPHQHDHAHQHDAYAERHHVHGDVSLGLRDVEHKLATAESFWSRADISTHGEIARIDRDLQAWKDSVYEPHSHDLPDHPHEILSQAVGQLTGAVEKVSGGLRQAQTDLIALQALSGAQVELVDNRLIAHTSSYHATEDHTHVIDGSEHHHEIDSEGSGTRHVHLYKIRTFERVGDSPGRATYYCDVPNCSSKMTMEIP